MCLVKYSVLIFYFLIFDAHALTCRSDGGPKESELKTIYTKCLKMQDGKNSSSSRDSGDQEWKENHRNQRNDWEGSQMKSDRGRNKDNNMRNRNEKWGTDDRMGNHDDRMENHDDRMGNHDDRMGNHDDRMGNYDDKMGHHDDGMGNHDGRMGNHNDRSDRYGRIGSRDNRMGNNRFGSEDNVNGRNDFQHEFGSDFSDQHGYQTTQASRRYKREKKAENSGKRSQFNPNSNNRYQDSNRSDEKNSSEKNTSTDDDKKACALHCFLENLEMTAEDGMPDRYLATHALTKDVKNEDLKDFLQESIEECFQILDNENTEDKCEFSKNLLMCLSEKGRENCDDWKDNLTF